jgi:hypothetical protein
MDVSLEDLRGRQRFRQACHSKEQVYRVNLIATRYNILLGDRQGGTLHFLARSPSGPLRLDLATPHFMEARNLLNSTASG